MGRGALQVGRHCKGTVKGQDFARFQEIENFLLITLTSNIIGNNLHPLEYEEKSIRSGLIAGRNSRPWAAAPLEPGRPMASAIA